MGKYNTYNVHEGMRIVGFIEASTYLQNEAFNPGYIPSGFLYPVPQGNPDLETSVFVMKQYENMTREEIDATKAFMLEVKRLIQLFRDNS